MPKRKAETELTAAPSKVLATEPKTKRKRSTTILTKLRQQLHASLKEERAKLKEVKHKIKAIKRDQRSLGGRRKSSAARARSSAQHISRRALARGVELM